MATLVLLLVLAAGLLASAAVHLERWFAGYRNIVSVIGNREYHLIGPLFLANVVAGVVLAAAVLLWRHWLPLLAAAGYAAATLVSFFADRTVGLFGPPSPLVFDTAEIVALVAEVVVIIAAVRLLRSSTSRPSKPTSRPT